MSRLFFYVKENVGYVHLTTKEVNGQRVIRRLSNTDAQKVANKLVRHFKLNTRQILANCNYPGYKTRIYPKLKFSNRRHDSGICHTGTWFIEVGNNPPLGVVVHEVGHLKYGKHNTKLLKFIGKMLNYCAKNDYWGLC